MGPPTGLPPTATVVEVERARLDARSGLDAGTATRHEARTVVLLGSVGILLAILAIWALSPEAAVLLPVLVAVLAAAVVAGAVVARRSAEARHEFAELRRRARQERPVRRRRRP